MRKLAARCCALFAAVTCLPVLLSQTTPYAEVPVLVVIYAHYYKDSDTQMDLTTDDVEVLEAIVQDSVEFFWRSSNLRCHVNTQFLVIDRTLTPEQMWFAWGDGGCWMPWWSMDGGATSVRDDVLAAGYQDGDVASVVALYAFESDEEVWAAIGGGSYGPDCGVLGRAGYVGIPLCWGIENIDSFFIHEYLHQLDAIFDSSGNPDDMFHADHPHEFPFPDHSSRHFNFLISRTLDPQSWLGLYEDWATLGTAPDADSDGVPDSGDLPITEETLGTAADDSDTDGDGLSDFDELVATHHDMSDPLSSDSDGDGLLDGEDPYPLYRLSNPAIGCGTPVIDGVITPGEYTEIACFDRWEPDIGAVVYARWTEDTLYFGAHVVDEALVTWFAEPWWCDHLEILINADRQDWFIDNVPGNYRFMVVPKSRHGEVLGEDYYYDPGYDGWHTMDTGLVVTEYELVADGYVLEVAIPTTVIPALDVHIAGLVQLTFNLVDIDQWEWPHYNVITARAGDYPGFVDLELTSTLGDLNADGIVDLSDLAQLLANYGTSSGAAYEDGDLDADGDVDLSDLAALLAVYGTSDRCLDLAVEDGLNDLKLAWRQLEGGGDHTPLSAREQGATMKLGPRV